MTARAVDFHLQNAYRTDAFHDFRPHFLAGVLALVSLKHGRVVLEVENLHIALGGKGILLYRCSFHGFSSKKDLQYILLYVVVTYSSRPIIIIRS